MDGFNELIHQPVRLKIMAALKALPEGEALEFVRLRALVDATEGNLGAHLATLDKAGYVQIEKDFAGNKPRTRIYLSLAGRGAFARHVHCLRQMLGGA